MKRFLPIFVVIVMLVSCISVSAKDPVIPVGEVLYHQSFGEVTDIVDSGVRIGSASSQNSFIACPRESLEVRTYDTGRVYLLLPEAEKHSDGTYTIEFTFRFTDVHTDNGYIAPILTCRGDEPTNISSVVIRADGSVDDFEEPADELREAVAGGETVGVKIPVDSWAIHEIIFEVGEAEYTLERDNVLMINEGSMGFVVRNTDVQIDEVYVVYGLDYEEKLGYYAENSYAADDSPAEDIVGGEEYAPDTADGAWVMLACAAVCGVGLVRLLRKERRYGI